MGKKILDFLMEYIISMISIIITSVLFWNFSPKDTISIKTFMLFVIPLGLYFIITIPQQKKYWCVTDKNIKLPKLKYVEGEICLFEASDLFSIGCFVSIFYMNKFEKFIGYGKVETIKSDNKMLQIVIIKFVQNYNYKFMNKKRKNIILKPTCPIGYMLDILKQGEKNE